MDVSLVLIVVMAVLFACGVYAMLERSLTRVLIGFLLLGNATNLLLLIVMGQPGVAPFFGAAASTDEMSDPLPQALTLTAIVITFGDLGLPPRPHLPFLAARPGRHRRGRRRATSPCASAATVAEDAMDDETEIAQRRRRRRTSWDRRPHPSRSSAAATSPASATTPPPIVPPGPAKSPRAASDRRRTVTTHERPRPAAGDPAAARRGDRPHRRPAPPDAGRRLGRDADGRAA